MALIIAGGVLAYIAVSFVVALLIGPLLKRARQGTTPLEPDEFILKNETHHWRDNNDGLEMAKVIARNAAKSRDGSSRVLAISNAHDPPKPRDTHSIRLNCEHGHGQLKLLATPHGYRWVCPKEGCPNYAS
jgi:hypothetical protein